MYQRSSKIGNFDYKEEIKQVMCIGEIVITLHKNRIEYRRIESGRDKDGEGEINDQKIDNDLIINEDSFTTPILYLHHPMAYLNKILLISDSQTSLYNFIKKKEIYKFKSFKKGVCVVRNTKVVDLVGVGYTNGQIDIINLKKDEILFSFKDLKVKDLKDLDFSNEKMCVVGGGDLYLFDLIEKRLILKTRAVSGKFIGEDYLLISKGDKDIEVDKDNPTEIKEKNPLIDNNISLFKIHNNSLNLIKVKNNLKSDILFLEEGSLDNTFVVVSKGEVFKYNTGNTLSYQKLKFKGKIEKMSFKGGEGVLYGDKILYKLGTSIKYALNSEIDLITNYKEISGILVDGVIIILNLNTKMIYKKIPVNEPIKCIKMDRNNLYLLYEERIRVVPYYKTEKWGSSIDGGDYKDSNGSIDIDLTPITPPITPIFFKVFDSLIVLSSNSGLFLFSNGILFRTFPGLFKDFTVSPNLKWLGVCKEDSILF
ncbi:WD repeat-containing protein 36 [Nosema bombycis CQ1]|uniref:WD repeat-containing protein 36 n=1 Tax=Nosema bombycis (strain CQ1 / CVCC 102059) TaxID=578461 RepID=R0MEG0_NOSB1|nr:WD repeat-containing protein 36 [Nosema bombycis CQ1]|eukprot:EOB11173.1 WD repeat-containing protein 36 [Nosema bombycis CQ1]